MARILCRYVECMFNEEGTCGAETIELDPDEGCLTYVGIEDMPEEGWEEEPEEGWEPEDTTLYLSEVEEEEWDDDL